MRHPKATVWNVKTVALLAAAALSLWTSCARAAPIRQGIVLAGNAPPSRSTALRGRGCCCPAERIAAGLCCCSQARIDSAARRCCSSRRGGGTAARSLAADGPARADVSRHVRGPGLHAGIDRDCRCGAGPIRGLAWQRSALCQTPVDPPCAVPITLLVVTAARGPARLPDAPPDPPPRSA